MAIAVVFMGLVGLIVAWWLAQQRLMAKPWLEEGPTGGVPHTSASPQSAARIGLGVFLAVVGSLFALFLSAYYMRMHMADWRPVPAPALLWLNTGLLVLSSIALHRAQLAARRGRADGMKAGLLAGGGFAVAFLVGQLLAWRQLYDAGFFLAANPANAFFYLITAAHGLHIMGGLVALGRGMVKMRRGFTPDQARLSVELCAIYWHFLLLVWLVLFGLLLST
ncbi:MAG TPA: cytochrome c oxidase subunit 3 [Alphaproteobacteria bacterium]|nr:cytochrome c oxidase subunit 3 [Alphaproteobacteria bacterium]